MSAKKLGLIAALTAAGAVAVGGAALANAATDSSPSPSSSSSSSNGTTDGDQKETGRGQHAHTPVTGDEAAKVTAAVKAEDSAVTVETVQKDPDGSYDVLGTKAGAPVTFDVSADLKTITERAGRGGHGGRGDGGRGDGGHGGNHTPVTGDEAAKVTAAVKAEDSAVTVESVRKDPDGSYDVLGTKAGAPVTFDVSADLKTITESAGRGGPGGGRGDAPRPSAPAGSGSTSPSASPTT